MGYSGLQGNGGVPVAQFYVVAQGLAYSFCFFAADHPAGAPVHYFQPVVDSRKVAAKRQVAVAKVYVASDRLDDSPADVTAVPEAVAEHVKDSNVGLGRDALADAD